MRKPSRARTEDDLTVDLSKLSRDELRAYIAGLRERREAMLHCDGACGLCMHGRACDAFPLED